MTIKMVTLNDLKLKRTTEKRKVSTSYNNIINRLAGGGYDEELVDMMKRLTHEFNSFITAYHAYADGLDKEGAAVTGHAHHADYQGQEAYFDEVSKKVSTANFKINLTKAKQETEELLGSYQDDRASLTSKLDSVKNKSVEDLMESHEVKALHDEVIPQVRSFEETRLKLIKSFRVLTRACEAATENLDVVKTKMGYDAVDEDLVNINTAARKLVAALQQQEKAEKLAKQKLETKATSTAAVKLEKIEAFKFSGEFRDWASFKRRFTNIVIPGRDPQDIGVRLLQSIPARHKHLIDNIDIGDHEKMMTELDRKFGKHCHIVSSCSEEIKNMTKPTTDKQFITMVERLEKIKADLEAIGYASSLDHVDIIRKVEARLPDLVKGKWLDYLKDKKLLEANIINDQFSIILKFLIDFKEMVDYEISGGTIGAEGKNRFCVVMGVTGSHSSSSHKAKVKKVKKFRWGPCLACHKEGAQVTEEMRHKTGDCSLWRKLTLENKKKLVNCVKHPFSPDCHKTENCERSVRCNICSSTQHHSLLCDKRRSQRSACKSATLDVCDNFGSPVEVSCAKTLVKAHIVKGRTEDENLDVMEDGGSTDSFVRIKKAEDMQLPSEAIVLSLEGINETKQVQSRVYKVPIRDKLGKLHWVNCYGLEEIANDFKVPAPSEYKELCDKFGIKPEDVRRPKQVDVLISAKDNFLMSDSVVNTINGVKLYQGPLGFTFMGDYEDIVSDFPEKIEQMKPLGGDCETEHLPRHQRQLKQLT